MKLTHDEIKKLRATRHMDDYDLIDDACELLTLKVVLWIKAKQKIEREAFDNCKACGDTQNALLRHGRAAMLGEIMVEISEAP